MTTYWQKHHLTSVDLISFRDPWISAPNKEKLDDVFLHIEVVRDKNDETKQITLVFLESELFEYFLIGLALRSH